MTTAADLIDDLRSFYEKHRQMPRAISMHPDFVDRITPDKLIPDETAKNEFHGVPFVVNPQLKADWKLIPPEDF